MPKYGYSGIGTSLSTHAKKWMENSREADPLKQNKYGNIPWDIYSQISNLKAKESHYLEYYSWTCSVLCLLQIVLHLLLIKFVPVHQDLCSHIIRFNTEWIWRGIWKTYDSVHNFNRVYFLHCAKARDIQARGFFTNQTCTGRWLRN
jgi:hypothetical protein